MSNNLSIFENHEPQIASKADQLVAMAERCEIINDEDMEKASDLVKFIKTAHKKAEDERKSFTDPINKSIKAFNAKFKVVTDPLKKSEKIVKEKILAFAMEKAKAEEEARLAAAIEAQDDGVEEQQVDAILEENHAPAVTRGDYGSTTSIRKVWKHELTDISKVPPEFLILDDRAIRAEIKNGVRDIPGVKIYEDSTVVSR